MIRFCLSLIDKSMFLVCIGVQMRATGIFSNALLGLGTVMLVLFVILELTGLRSDPLLPALSALALGGTAILDRIGQPKESQ